MSGMPGYTGHLPANRQVIHEEDLIPKARTAHIPGYCGYIPAVKSENLFGKTYGVITDKSATGNFAKGIDAPLNEKYCSMNRENYINQRELEENVQKERDEMVRKQNKEVDANIPASVKAKFFGGEEDADFFNQAEFDKNADLFYGASGSGSCSSGNEAYSTAKAAFWGSNDVEASDNVGQKSKNFTLNYEEVKRRVAHK